MEKKLALYGSAVSVPNELNYILFIPLFLFSLINVDNWVTLLELPPKPGREDSRKALPKLSRNALSWCADCG